MPGWNSTLQAEPAGQTFADLYEAADGKLADEVVNAFASQLVASSIAARNIFLERVAERVANPVDRANLIARLNNPVGGTVPVQVRVRRDLLDQIDARAFEEGVTRSDVVRGAIEVAMSRHRIRAIMRHPVFHYRWTRHSGSLPSTWTQFRGTASELLNERARVRSELDVPERFDEALFMERSRVILWTVIGPDGRTDETRWNRVLSENVDDVLIDAGSEYGITVYCA